MSVLFSTLYAKCPYYLVLHTIIQSGARGGGGGVTCGKRGGHGLGLRVFWVVSEDARHVARVRGWVVHGLQHTITRSAHEVAIFLAPPPTQRYFTGMLAEGCQENYDIMPSVCGEGIRRASSLPVTAHMSTFSSRPLESSS